MNLRQLRKLVNETVRAERRKTKRSTPNRARRNWSKLVESPTKRVLSEALTDKTNTGDQEAVKGLVDALFDDIPKFKEMMGDLGAGWGVGSDKFASDEDIAAKRDEIFGDKETVMSRFEDLNKKLDAGDGYAKPYMPAFEGSDLEAITDALDSTEGDFGVDFKATWNEDEEDFAKFYAANKETYHKKATELNKDPELVEESANLYRWHELAGLLNEGDEGGEDGDSFSGGGSTPFPGPAKKMKGAYNVGNDAKSKPDLYKSIGPARAYLTKGKGTGDKLSIKGQDTLPHSGMKPTQTEVKLGKTMAFALNDIGQDMGGSWADSEGNI